MGFVEQADRTEIKIRVDVRETLTALGIPFWVASNARTFRQRHFFEMTGLLSMFEPNVFGTDLVDRPKPAPDLVFALCRSRPASA